MANLYGFAIPIVIKGNMDNPEVRLDMEGLMKAIADQQLKKAKTQVEEKIKEKINDKAGELLNNILGH